MFPTGSADQRLMTQLLNYASVDEGCGHALDFQLVGSGDTSAFYWFARDADTASQFTVFAKSGNGGLFSYWMGDPSKIEGAPIVYLGSEGAAKVIASTFADFLSILAVDYHDLEFTLSSDAWSATSDSTVDMNRFREWLEMECQITPAFNPEQVVTDAQGQHPPIESFVEKWADRWFD